MGSRYLLLTGIAGRYTPKSDWPVYAEIGIPNWTGFWTDYAEIEMA